MKRWLLYLCVCLLVLPVIADERVFLTLARVDDPAATKETPVSAQLAVEYLNDHPDNSVLAYMMTHGSPCASADKCTELSTQICSFIRGAAADPTPDSATFDNNCVARCDDYRINWRCDGETP